MKKATREHVEALSIVAETFGAKVTHVTENGHVKLHLKLKGGREITHAVCSTPSDHRSRLNDTSDFRRRLRELNANG